MIQLSAPPRNQERVDNTRNLLILSYLTPPPDRLSGFQRACMNDSGALSGYRSALPLIAKLFFFRKQSNRGSLYFNTFLSANVARSPRHSWGSLVHRACPVIADTEGVGVTQYPLDLSVRGEMPTMQQADGGNFAPVALSGLPDSAALVFPVC